MTKDRVKVANESTDFSRRYTGFSVSSRENSCLHLHLQRNETFSLSAYTLVCLVYVCNDVSHVCSFKSILQHFTACARNNKFEPTLRKFLMPILKLHIKSNIFLDCGVRTLLFCFEMLIEP